MIKYIILLTLIITGCSDTDCINSHKEKYKIPVYMGEENGIPIYEHTNHVVEVCDDFNYQQ